MRIRAAPSLVACALLLAGTLALAQRSAPEVRLGDLALHEGGSVAVEGLAARVRTEGGRTRFDLLADGVALRATAPALALAEGAWVRAEGRLVRSAGALLLAIDDPADLRAGPAPARPLSWSEVAREPWSHLDEPIELAGTIAGGRLRSDDGHAVALTDGDWPRSGAFRVRGHLAYEPACLCIRLHAAEVRAWTP